MFFNVVFKTSTNSQCCGSCPDALSTRVVVPAPAMEHYVLTGAWLTRASYIITTMLSPMPYARSHQVSRTSVGAAAGLQIDSAHDRLHTRQAAVRMPWNKP